MQAQLASKRAAWLRRMDGKLVGRPSGSDFESPYLLSGIAECGVCSGSLVAMTRSHGRQRVPFYGCMGWHKRSVHVCRNGLQIRQDVLDGAVLDALAKALDVDMLADAVRAALAMLRAERGDMDARRVAIARELDVIAGRERRLLDALADGDDTAGAIRERLKAELGRRDALTAELATLQARDPVDDEALVRTVTKRAAEARELLGRQVAQARQMIRALLDGRLVCEPFDEGDARGYTFEALGTYRRFIRELEVANVGGGPNGIRTRVSALRGPCPRPLDDGAELSWLGEEDSNPRYQGQNLASYP